MSPVIREAGTGGLREVGRAGGTAPRGRRGAGIAASLRASLAVLAALGALGGLGACAGGGPDGRPRREGVVPIPSVESRGGRPERVVLVAVSGLVASDYLAGADFPVASGSPAEAGAAPAMPTLAALAEDGVAVERLVPVAPASTSPALATLITGRRPASHGVVAERLLGEHGVRRTGYEHASRLRGPLLWSVLGVEGRGVAALDWPTTVGAEIPLLLPAVRPGPADRGWLLALADKTTPWLFGRLRALGGAALEVARPGAARDALLVGLACEVLASAAAPDLLLLHLSQVAVAEAEQGPRSALARAARRRVDALLERLLACLASAGRLGGTALAVAGDGAVRTAHTLVFPNGILAREGLLQPASGLRLRSWRAVARSNGGSAFVYARSEADAVQARRALEAAAERTGFFRVVPAAEMLALGADPEAWFGLEAAPGFVLADVPQVPAAVPAAVAGAQGYLPPVPVTGPAAARAPRFEGGRGADPTPGLVLWGRGIRAGVQVPWMRQVDVAPTLARLLGVSLEEAQGEVWVGLLALAGAKGGAGGAEVR